MALAYTPPGVNVEELYSPSVNPLLSVSASICLVGPARGYELGVAQVQFATEGGPRTLTAPTGSVFQKVDTDTTFDRVVNVLNPTAGSAASQGGYEEGTDFTTTLSADKRELTVTPVDESDLDNDGGLLRFTYRFVSDKYFEPIRLDSQSAVEARFGPAFDTAGIVTPLSAAAALAFENGAATVVIQPLFKVTGGVAVEPTAAEAAQATNWIDTLNHLRDVEDINIIVPVVGQSDANVGDATQLAIFEAIQDHCRYMETQGQYIIGIFGEDSSGDITDATLATLRAHAETLRARYDGFMAEQTVVVSPTRFKRVLPSNNNQTLLVGGQFVAAALAGMIAARPVVVPLTRKQVSGFVEVSMPDYDKPAKDADATAGLLVVEQKGSVIQVRHGVTLNNTDTAKRELSVVRAKHRMVESIRQTLDTQIIGTVPADGNAPVVVKNAVVGVLESLRGGGELVDYSGVEARVLTNDPTTVECRFSYRPSFPLNYVHVVFSLDLTAGEVTTTTLETTV
jgi:hypothetical protein